MGSRITNIEPCGKMILLRFNEIKEKDMFKLKGTLLVPNEKSADEKKRVYATVEKIGPEVDLSTIIYKVGDRVFYNDYDIKVRRRSYIWLNQSRKYLRCL
jgi:co-chaperonin GroES (HSP10)